MNGCWRRSVFFFYVLFERSCASKTLFVFDKRAGSLDEDFSGGGGCLGPTDKLLTRPLCLIDVNLLLLVEVPAKLCGVFRVSGNWFPDCA